MAFSILEHWSPEYALNNVIVGMPKFDKITLPEIEAVPADQQ